MRVSGRNKENSTGVVTDDALKWKTEEALLVEDEKGEDIQQKTEEQKLDTAVPEEMLGKGDGVEKEMEKQPEKMDDAHQEPQKNKTKADQFLTRRALPQGDEVRQAHELAVKQPEHIQVEELPRAGKVPVDIPKPIQEW